MSLARSLYHLLRWATSVEQQENVIAIEFPDNKSASTFYEEAKASGEALRENSRLLPALHEGAVEAVEAFRYVAAVVSGSRLTDSDYQKAKNLGVRLDGWERNDRIGMWIRHDYADLDRIAQLERVLDDAGLEYPKASDSVFS